LATPGSAYILMMAIAAQPEKPRPTAGLSSPFDCRLSNVRAGEGESARNRDANISPKGALVIGILTTAVLDNIFRLARRRWLRLLEMARKTNFRAFAVGNRQAISYCKSPKILVRKAAHVEIKPAILGAYPVAHKWGGASTTIEPRTKNFGRVGPRVRERLRKMVNEEGTILRRQPRWSR
jgi:hypothetical protein